MKKSNLKLIFVITFITSTLISIAQTTKWTTKDGWVMRMGVNDKNYEKFFAIGIWQIPNYNFNQLTLTEESKKFPKNRKEFINNTSDFNLSYFQSGYNKSYMSNMIGMVGTSELDWVLKNTYNKDNKKNSYYFMRELENNLNSSRFKKTVNEGIDIVTKHFKSFDYIWALFDEIANGYENWNWPTVVTDSIYAEIKKRTPDKLVYIDLIGSLGGVGNTFLFEQHYKKSHKFLPKDPPFNFLTNNNKYNSSHIDFQVDFNGTQIFDKNGKIRSNNIDKQIWYENIKRTASGYKNSGDIFGINAYDIAFESPDIIGLTVDAIKEGTSKNTPVWIFFDSNGYAKPLTQSITDYINNVKCQIYTSLVHEATGLLFYNDTNKSDKVFKAILPLINELNRNKHILYLNTVEKNVRGDIHYIVKENSNKSRYLIAVNTNKNDAVFFVNNFSKKKYFLPLEVYISKI